MNEIYFSIIIYLDDESEVERCIKSVLSSSNKTQKETRIIVVDPMCSEYTLGLCTQYKQRLGESNFVYIKTLNMSMASAYNVAIPEIKGRYVNFICSSMFFSPTAIEMIRMVSEKENRPKVITISPWTENEKKEKLQYLMSPKRNANIFLENISVKSKSLDLNLMLHSYFIRCYLVNSKERHMWFNEGIEDDCAIEFLLRLITEFPNNLFLPKETITYKYQLEDNFSAYKCQHYDWWYIQTIDKWMLPFIQEIERVNGIVPRYIKSAVFYLVYVKFRANSNYSDKKVLDDVQLEEFYLQVSSLLQYVDNKMIFDKNVFGRITIPRRLRMWFLELKAQKIGKVCEPVVFGNKLCLWTHEAGIGQAKNQEMVKDFFDQKVVFCLNNEDRMSIPSVVEVGENETLINLCELTKEHVVLQAINYINGYLEIDGILSLGNFLSGDKIKLYVIKDGSLIETNQTEVYGCSKIFGRIYEEKYMFHAQVYVSAYKGKAKIKFAVEINGNLIEIGIRTGKPYTHIQQGITGQYWNFDKNWCLSFLENDILLLENVSDGQLKVKEKKYQQELANLAKKKNSYAAAAIEIRKEYFGLKKAGLKKRIWVTFDKLYKAGDNGEYIFHYVDENVEDIDIYYLINNDAPDYDRLKENANVLVWGENGTIAKILHAEAILTTHGDIAQYIGLEPMLAPFLCDLLNSINVCIQHGLTVQDIAKFQNRLFTNLHLYLCASENEIKNISRPVFGYERNQIRLVGLARYDGLKNRDQRQILITPSWRRNVTNTNIVHATNLYNVDFKNSDYFKIYNKLINDEKMINSARKNNYKLIYLIHPALGAQIDDFNKNEYVEIIAATSDMSYEKILTESSLMVTDYSGVQFDFAYMRKPLLYYHPSELPPHYDESIGYSYERDAFGPLIKLHDELVTQLCEYMENGCKMKEEIVFLRMMILIIATEYIIRLKSI